MFQLPSVVRDPCAISPWGHGATSAAWWLGVLVKLVHLLSPNHRNHPSANFSWSSSQPPSWCPPSVVVGSRPLRRITQPTVWAALAPVAARYARSCEKAVKSDSATKACAAAKVRELQRILVTTAGEAGHKSYGFPSGPAADAQGHHRPRLQSGVLARCSQRHRRG
jgi:hypothetical protein